MPVVPTVDAPTQSLSGGPLNITPPPEAFGANVVGEALAKLGDVGQHTSDMLAQHAEQFQAINNKAEADTAYVAHLQAANAFAAEYQANNRGAAAFTNLPDAYATLKKQRDDIAGTLSNPMARAMFDADSRRATANITGELTRFAVSQRKEAVLKSFVAVQEAGISDSAIHPENLAANLAKGVEQQALINQQLGLGEEEGKLAARQWVGKAVSQVALVQADQGDPDTALATLEKYKDGMDGQVYQQTLSKLRPALMTNAAAKIGDAAVASALHGFGTPGGLTSDYVAAVNAGEGTGKNPRSSAEGIGQFTKGTWLSVVKGDPQFAADVAGKSDAEILALRNDPAVAGRAIIAYRDQNATALQGAGKEVNPQTLGLAHRFGSGDATKLLSADPSAAASTVLSPKVIAANPYLANQTVGQAIAGATKHFAASSVDSTAGGVPTSFDLKAVMPSVLATADRLADQTHPGNAAFKDVAEARATATLNKQIAARSDAEFASYNTLAVGIQANNSQDIADVLKQPGALSAWNSLPANYRYALLSDIKKNAANPPPEAVGEMARINGLRALAANDPAPFLNEDIAGNAALPQKFRLAAMKAQQQARAKALNNQESDVIANRWMSAPLTANALNRLNIGKMDSDEALQFRGMLANDIHVWEMSNGGKVPTDSDMSPIVSGVVAQLVKKGQIRAPQVSAQDLPGNVETAAIRAEAQRRGYNVTQADIEAIYRSRHNAR